MVTYKTWWKLRVVFRSEREFEWRINSEELSEEVQSKIASAMDDSQRASVVTFFDHDGDFVALNSSEILYAITVKRVDGDYGW